MQNETVEKIKNDDSVENAYPILLEYTVINNIFGTTSGYAAFMDEADIREIFDNFSLTVTEGRLPEENSYELIMHEDMLKNKGLSVGDTFGSAVDEGEQIDGKYTITGAFSGDSYMAFGTKSYRQKELEELGLDFQNTTFGLLVTPKTDLDTMNNMLDTMSHDETAAMTLCMQKKRLKENISSIKFLMFVICDCNAEHFLPQFALFLKPFIMTEWRNLEFYMPLGIKKLDYLKKYYHRKL